MVLVSKRVALRSHILRSRRHDTPKFTKLFRSCFCLYELVVSAARGVLETEALKDGCHPSGVSCLQSSLARGLLRRTHHTTLAVAHNDERQRVDGNFGGAKHDEPNSFGEWQEQQEHKESTLSLKGDAQAWNFREDDEDYYYQPGNLFRLMTPDRKELLFINTAAEVSQAGEFIQVRHIKNCYEADPAYG